MIFTTVIFKYSKMTTKNVSTVDKLSINQFYNQSFLYHHYNEFLILYKFVRRFLQILQMSRIHKNFRKSTENVYEQ